VTISYRYHLAPYDKRRFTQILINRQTKDRLDMLKETLANDTKAVSYNDAIITLLDSVSVTSGGQSFLLVK
jgi:hypothetical protein